MALIASCLSCGVGFQYQPSNSTGKYCSWECMQTHRSKLSAISGIQFRKLILRGSVHGEINAIRMWARICRESDAVKYVLTASMIAEREAVDAELQRLYAAMTDSEKAVASKEMARLDRAMKLRPPSVRISCPDCKAECPEYAGSCHKCGRTMDDVGVIQFKNEVKV